MNQFLRLFMTALLALCMVLSQGFMQPSRANMQCCQETSAIRIANCCVHHIKTRVHSENANEYCFCNSPAPVNPVQTAHDTPELKTPWVTAYQSSPMQCLQPKDGDTPIWLYWQFQPDRSKLYLQKNSWLL